MRQVHNSSNWLLWWGFKFSLKWAAASLGAGGRGTFIAVRHQALAALLSGLPESLVQQQCREGTGGKDAERGSGCIREPSQGFGHSSGGEVGIQEHRESC